MEDYSHNLITTLGDWEWYVHKKQFHLGRSYLWLATPEFVDRNIASLNEQDWMDFGTLLQRTMKATQRVFAPDDIEWANLQNEAHHLHVHLVPRYQTPQTFMGIEFPADPCFGEHYSEQQDYNRFAVPDTLLTRVRDMLREEIEK